MNPNYSVKRMLNLPEDFEITPAMVEDAKRAERELREFLDKRFMPLPLPTTLTRTSVRYVPPTVITRDMT